MPMPEKRILIGRQFLAAVEYRGVPGLREYAERPALAVVRTFGQSLGGIQFGLADSARPSPVFGISAIALQ